jgi:MFS family permease
MGCVVGIAAFLGGVLAGFIAGQAVRFFTLNDQLSVAIGVGVWILSFLVFFAYGLLFTKAPEEFRPPSANTSPWRQRRKIREEGMLQTAELRMAFVFGLISACAANYVNAPHWLTAVIAAPCALVGALIGYDLKRRTLKIRSNLPEIEEP